MPPPELAAICERAMQRDISARFAGATDLATRETTRDRSTAWCKRGVSRFGVQGKWICTGQI
jgi:hypothetical protein